MGDDDLESKENGLRHRNVEAAAPPEEDPEPTTALGILKKWPKSTFCIIGNEFCERFSYYGMRAVLMLYFINVLKFSKKSSIILFHAFTVFAYTSPLFGSILADGYIGKFRTILSLSVVYAIGQITLAVASSFHLESGIHPWLDIIGLFVIGFGTGGIKPCVAAFGGDQFKPNHVKMISMFFSMFYFMINAGSTVSTWITPLFRVSF
uniref:MFS domain-containing protein n=1 Tax=Panagrellus redivivus TaxID=6233 RepID=A0A7E4V1U2_PANRE